MVIYVVFEGWLFVCFLFGFCINVVVVFCFVCLFEFWVLAVFYNLNFSYDLSFRFINGILVRVSFKLFFL